MPAATARLVVDEAELAAALALRHEVFCLEQGVSEEDELDGRDAEAEHLVVVDDDGTVVATCRLLHGSPDGDRERPATKLGRMAVRRDLRGRGLARALLDEADVRAARVGSGRIVLTAQLDAIGLYERAGYAAWGDVFLDAGIEHRWMAKDVA
ncbi:GNAT family N-acetyltransferase [Conexibacter sp. SYSU D00693]|uniref:GNAT family N-acetyltransferase n=1 Tax=Conexibacter sp. SYSU D00693 TaxID=2812560 RepID=UPI00196AF495|nr:GNAT family N-acetyltransferase [Conexibacter sp. SYSU D00693]